MEKELESCTHIREIINTLPEDEVDHMRRVGILTDLLAKQASSLGMYQGDIEWSGLVYFGKAASYHDIGKAWIPKKLLLKCGELTNRERLIIQLHPIYAQILSEEVESGIVSGLPKYLRLPAFRSAEYHHERWDGKGYPYGLAALNIPLIARITAICDAYDTVTSERAYKAALSHETACHELQVNAGTQFDPLLTKAFLQNRDKFALPYER